MHGPQLHRSCRSRRVELEAKLALVEFLLTSTDLQASARRAVDWLAAHAGSAGAVVACPNPPAPAARSSPSTASRQRRDRGLRADPRRRGASADRRRCTASRRRRYFDGRRQPFRIAARGDGLPRHPAARRRASSSRTACCWRARRHRSCDPDVTWLARTAGQAGVAAAEPAARSPRRASARSGCCSTASSTPSPIRSC